MHRGDCACKAYSCNWLYMCRACLCSDWYACSELYHGHNINEWLLNVRFQVAHSYNVAFKMLVCLNLADGVRHFHPNLTIYSCIA